MLTAPFKTASMALVMAPKITLIGRPNKTCKSFLRANLTINCTIVGKEEMIGWIAIAIRPVSCDKGSFT